MLGKASYAPTDTAFLRSTDGFPDRALQLRSIAAACQNLTLSNVICRAYDAFGFHSFDDSGGAVVADLEMTLYKARRGLAFAADHRNRLRVKLVSRFILSAAKRVERRIIVLG